MTAQIPATATVDALGEMAYSVEVTGALDYAEYRRVYVLKATSERNAAMKGLEMFVEEIENLDEAELEDK